MDEIFHSKSKQINDGNNGKDGLQNGEKNTQDQINGNNGRRNHHHYPRHSPKYMLSHMTQMEMYKELEDEYMCSGMCEQGLFYFGIDIHWGIPKHTCLIDF